MTDWPSEIEKQRRILEQLEQQVPLALQNSALDLTGATELFQELDKHARACEQIAVSVRNLDASSADLSAAEAICERMDALVRAAADRMMALRHH